MTKYANEYSYERIYSFDEKTKTSSYVNSKLKSLKNNRYYQTKMNVDDLPENYCDVQRYGAHHNVIRTDNIKDLKYHWVKENHFMKDSLLRVSFTGEIKEKPIYININGKPIESIFKDYENMDSMVFGNSIFKFLGYVKKYSNYDISEIRNQFVKQCEWLKENEPSFAPDTDDFGKWFDDTINKATLWQA